MDLTPAINEDDWVLLSLSLSVPGQRFFKVLGFSGRLSKQRLQNFRLHKHFSYWQICRGGTE